MDMSNTFALGKKSLYNKFVFFFISAKGETLVLTNFLGQP